MQVPGLQISQISWTVKVPGYVWSSNKCPILRQMVRAPQEMLCSPKCTLEHGCLPSVSPLSQMRAPAEIAWVYCGVKIPCLYLSGSCSTPGPTDTFSCRFLWFESPEGEDNSWDPGRGPRTRFLTSIPGEPYAPCNVVSCHVMPKQVGPGKEHQLRSKEPWPGIQDVSLITWASFDVDLMPSSLVAKFATQYYLSKCCENTGAYVKVCGPQQECESRRSKEFHIPGLPTGLWPSQTTNLHTSIHKILLACCWRSIKACYFLF